MRKSLCFFTAVLMLIFWDLSILSAAKDDSAETSATKDEKPTWGPIPAGYVTSRRHSP